MAGTRPAARQVPASAEVAARRFRFNRARYDAEATVAMYEAQLKDAVDLDSVRDDLASVVQQAMEPSHLSVWITSRD